MQGPNTVIFASIFLIKNNIDYKYTEEKKTGKLYYRKDNRII